MTPVRIAWFISPHGFGHAARSCAVMEQLYARDSAIQFDIYTLVPEWFFSESLPCPFKYYPLETDVGLVQITPLKEDIPATVTKLSDFLNFSPKRIEPLAESLRSSECRLAVCDISPLGILAANRAGIPSVLQENFTWDWIYQEYAAQEPRMEEFSSLLKDIYASVDHHIQTAPGCTLGENAFVTAPVSRACRSTSEDIRQQLSIGQDSPVVLFSLGGTNAHKAYTHSAATFPDITFIIPDPSVQTIIRKDSCIHVPIHSSIYHPDLVAAADAVVAKVGYSTLAEVYAAGVPFGYFIRETFRESFPLAAFIEQNMPCQKISGDILSSGHWVETILPLLSKSKGITPKPNGAQAAAEYIIKIYE